MACYAHCNGACERQNHIYSKSPQASKLRFVFSRKKLPSCGVLCTFLCRKIAVFMRRLGESFERSRLQFLMPFCAKNRRYCNKLAVQLFCRKIAQFVLNCLFLYDIMYLVIFGQVLPLCKITTDGPPSGSFCAPRGRICLKKRRYRSILYRYI